MTSTSPRPRWARTWEPGGGRYLNGRLDEFAIYHRALSGLEIERLYTAQAAWAEERQTVEMVVDARRAGLLARFPTRPTAPTATPVLHVGAQDPATVDSVPASGVDRVIWRVNSGAWREAPPCRDAEPGAAWCPTFDPTVLGGEGAHTIETYAIDRVGNQGAASSTGPLRGRHPARRQHRHRQRRPAPALPLPLAGGLMGRRGPGP